MRATKEMRDRREIPAYGIAEAARFLRLSPTTLRSWVNGRSYVSKGRPATFERLIQPAKRDPLFLSFWNLVEAHVLWSLRIDHGVSIQAVRTAARYAERSLKIDRLLLSQELKTTGGELFLERYGELIHLSVSGQLAMRKMFQEHLKRVEWDQFKAPIRLYPMFDAAEQSIVIDPAVGFGRPLIKSRSVSTRIVVERLDHGESVADLARDYEVLESEIEEAVLFERAA